MSPFPPPKNIQNITSEPPIIAGRSSVIYIWAAWDDNSSPGGVIDKIFTTLSNQPDLSSSSKVNFYRVEAEAAPELCQKVRWEGHVVCKEHLCCVCKTVHVVSIYLWMLSTRVSRLLLHVRKRTSLGSHVRMIHQSINLHTDHHFRLSSSIHSVWRRCDSLLCSAR